MPKKAALPAPIAARASTQVTAEAVKSLRLPRGVNKLPRREVLKLQRARLIEGIGHAVAERGYADTAVSHVLSHAGVSRAAFYELFKDKEDCFLQGFHALSRYHLRLVEEANAAAGSLPEQMLAGMTAYMQLLDVDAHMARAFVVEAEAASPAIRTAFLKAGDRIENLIYEWHQRVRAAHLGVPECSALTLRALREALTGVVIGRIKQGGRSLTSDVTTVVTLVFAALGLYAWAKQSEGGIVPKGRPR